MSMSKDSAYTEGYKAYKKGVEVYTCPYAKGSNLDLNWRAGWYAAYDEDDSVF